MSPPKYGLLRLSGAPLRTMVSVVATTAFLLFGYDQGVMSGIITSEALFELLPQLRGNPTMQGLVTAIYELGCLAGAIFALVAGDKLGRKKTIFLGATTMIVGVIIQITAQAGHSPLAQFIIGRIIMGIGNGANTATVPAYQGECASTSSRGTLIALEGIVIAWGSFLSYWIDYGASKNDNGAIQVKVPIALQIIFGLIVAISVLFIVPESPRWLCLHGRDDEAAKVLAMLRNREIDSDDNQRDLAGIKEGLRISGVAGSHQSSYKALFVGGKQQNLRRALLGASSQFFQQIGGCNAVIYYVPVLLETSLGATHDRALFIGGFNMLVYALFSCLSLLVVEKWGRRKLFLIGSAGQSIAMVLVFAFLIPNDADLAKGAIFGLFLYIAIFGFTWLPLPWLYPSEINSLKCKTASNAISTSTNWLWNFAVVMWTPIMVNNIGWGTYLFYAAINALFIPVVLLFYPETAGLKLEEIDLLFAVGYTEKISYVEASKRVTKMSPQEREAEFAKHRLTEEEEAVEKGAASSDDNSMTSRRVVQDIEKN